MRRLTLAATLLIFSAPALFAQSPAAPTPPNATPAAPLAYDVISIHPTKSVMTTVNNSVTFSRMFIRETSDSYHVENATLKYIISSAYNIKDDSIIGGPAWLGSNHFDIDAKVTPSRLATRRWPIHLHRRPGAAWPQTHLHPRSCQDPRHRPRRATHAKLVP